MVEKVADACYSLSVNCISSVSLDCEKRRWCGELRASRPGRADLPNAVAAEHHSWRYARIPADQRGGARQIGPSAYIMGVATSGGRKRVAHSLHGRGERDAPLA
jgi:hypothetical protein